MKKSIVAVAAGAVILGLSFQASAGVANTKHNMSSIANAGGGMTGVNGDNRIYSTDNPEICIYCHTPHNAIKNDTIPLWNHTLSAVTTYGVYTSPTLDADDVGGIADLGAANSPEAATTSNLCLSCHDGTVAINAINNPSNSNMFTTMTGGDSVGPLPDGIDGRALGADWNTNLRKNATADNETLLNDHPVNFNYGLVAAEDDSIWDQGYAEDRGVKFFAGTMQCPSCHDPHNDTIGEQPFLRASIDGSALCLVCHDK